MKKKTKLWRCSTDRVKHKWLNKKNMTFLSARFPSNIRTFSKGDRWKCLKTLWLLGNKLLSSAFPAIPSIINQPPNTTIKGYRDNQSANSSLWCLLDAAMKDFMSPWVAAHLTPLGHRPRGLYKSGEAIEREGGRMREGTSVERDGRAEKGRKGHGGKRDERERGERLLMSKNVNRERRQGHAPSPGCSVFTSVCWWLRSTFLCMIRSKSPPWIKL